MSRRIVLLVVLTLCLSLASSAAKAVDSVTFQNRLGVEATVTWSAGNGLEPVRIQGNVPDGGVFSVPSDILAGRDRLLVQPYIDSSFQFYTPFTLDRARAINYSSPAPGGPGRLLAPRLTALVGDERVSVPAGLPLCRLVALMAGGMSEEAVEQWLVALRLPGEKPGRYAVAVGEATWGYRDGELLFASSASGQKQVAEIRLTTPWAPEALPGIAADMRKSGLCPLLLTVEGRGAKAFGPAGAALDPEADPLPENPEEAWTEVAKLLANAVNGAASDTPAADMVLASDGLRHTLSLDGKAGIFILRITRK